MIYHLRQTPPLIDFGFGVMSKQVQAGQKATVWLSTLYNNNAYTFTLIASGGAVNTVSDYEFEVSYDTPGTYEISLSVRSKSRKIKMMSNPITLTVI